MKSLVACVLLSTCTPVFASDLYHCTINDVTDGFFTTTDMMIDGPKFTGTTLIHGKETQIGSNPFVYIYEGEKDDLALTIIYAEGRGLVESISFSLLDVTSKLGTAKRYTTKEGFGTIERDVNMICDIATPI